MFTLAIIKISNIVIQLKCYLLGLMLTGPEKIDKRIVFLFFTHFFNKIYVGRVETQAQANIVDFYMPDICQTVPDSKTISTVKQKCGFREGYALETVNCVKTLAFYSLHSYL